MEFPDPERYLWLLPEKARPGVSPEGQGGAEEDPRESPLEEDWEDFSEAGCPAPRGAPPAKASGIRTGSDVDRMSNDVMVEYLHCKLKAVNRFQDPAVREFLKDKLWEAKSFFCLLQEKQQLQAQESRLKAANQRLQQELQESRRSQRTGNLTLLFPKWSKTDFHIQVHVTGKIGGCEKQFLKKVSEHLSNINLKMKRYRESSSHFLLVFCPVSSRVGTDMANALEDLKGEPKAVLVMLHHKPKESTSYVGTKPQAQHPAVVRTIHARYTLCDGFYDCPMNEEAVDAVAEVLEDRCKGGKGDPTTPGAPSSYVNPTNASGSRTGLDLDGMSNDVMVEFLHCKLKSVSLYSDPAVREFLKDKLWEAKAFDHRLQEKKQPQAQESWLTAENQRLQQELQESRRSQRTGNLTFSLPKWSKTDFHIQVRVAGKTGGCENEFLKKVSAHLSYHHMYLKVERYQEGSGHFLLVFCPVATAVGSDMKNALEGLSSKPKAILVMLHHKLKESTSPVDTKKQADHPAVVRTLHARYTLESGFYTCPMNEEAVAVVAKVLQDHR